jgi:hypothetical protein
MKKLLPLILTFGVFSGSTAHGMPVAALSSAQATPLIQVGWAYGPWVCGPRLPGSLLGQWVTGYIYVPGCYRRYSRSTYAGRRVSRDPYISQLPGFVIHVDKGTCGFGSFLSCTHGLCYRFCQ